VLHQYAFYYLTAITAAALVALGLFAAAGWTTLRDAIERRRDARTRRARREARQ